MRAIGSCLNQNRPPSEIIIATDPGVPIPEIRAGETGMPIRWVSGEIPGHQSACNAAVLAAESPLLAFLEDDDLWRPDHLKIMHDALTAHGADFASTSHQEIDIDGNLLKPFDWPTATGWLMTRSCWRQCGGFHVGFKVHQDNHFLGMLNRHKRRRIHAVEEGADPNQRPLIRQLVQFTPIVQVRGQHALWTQRTIHPDSIMSHVHRDSARAQRSAKEYGYCEIEFGHIPS
jgi:hypothetical protein